MERSDRQRILAKLDEMVNILIHRYAHVDDGIVYRHLNDYLDDFYKFKDAIESYLGSAARGL